MKMKRLKIILICCLTTACQTVEVIKEPGYYTEVEPVEEIKEVHSFDELHEEAIEKGKDPEHKENHVHNETEIKGNGEWYGLVRFTDKKPSTPTVSTFRRVTSPTQRKETTISSIPQRNFVREEDIKRTFIQTDQNQKYNNNWIFNTGAKYTIQYTSTPSESGANKLAENVRSTKQRNAYVYQVENKNNNMFIVLSGEFENVEDAKKDAEKGNWVRKISNLRHNRCSTKDRLANKGIYVHQYCQGIQ